MADKWLAPHLSYYYHMTNYASTIPRLNTSTSLKLIRLFCCPDIFLTLKPIILSSSPYTLRRPESLNLTRLNTPNLKWPQTDGLPMRGPAKCHPNCRPSTHLAKIPLEVTMEIQRFSK